MQRLYLIVLMVVFVPPLIAENANFYIVRYSPGSNWDKHVSYYEQRGIKQHLDYLRDLYDRERLLMSGPLVDLPGSMVIIKGGSLNAVRQFVASDPAVLGKLLESSVSGWKVYLSSLSNIRGKTAVELDADEPFRLERRDHDAPINLPRN